MDATSSKLFQNMTAWFSQSVSRDRIELWKQYGGDIAPVDRAHYVFSEDARHEDTSCLYASEEFVNENLAVFDASYVEECVKQGKRDGTSASQFILPPPDLQDSLLRYMRRKVGDKSGGDNEMPNSDAYPTGDGTDPYGYLHIDMFPMADEDDIEEFVVGQNGCEVFRKVQQPALAQQSTPAQQQQQQQKTSGRHR